MSTIGRDSIDLLVRGGTVVDPAVGMHTRADVAIADGRILAVGEALHARAARVVLDASDRLVVPGLIDLHTHVYDGATYWGIAADAFAASAGVTTWTDAGSAGAYNIGGFVDCVATQSRVRILAFLNISAIGLVGRDHELADLSHLDPDLAANAGLSHPDVVRGVKVRMGFATAGHHRLEPLHRARAAAERLGLPLMVHIAHSPPSLAEVLELVRPGDIVTHALTGLTMSGIDSNGAVRDELRVAVERGVRLDVGHGTGSFSFETARRYLDSGIQVDTISTDLHQLSATGPMFDLPTCMTKMLHLGMPVDDVIRSVTATPANILGEPDVGTLKPGSRADIAILDLESGSFPLFDSQLNKSVAGRRFVVEHTVLGGVELDRVAQPSPKPWVPLSATQSTFFADPQRGLEPLQDRMRSPEDYPPHQSATIDRAAVSERLRIDLGETMS